jgi:GNAT superfamily N-acetyltransferase
MQRLFLLARKLVRQIVRRLISWLPRSKRFKIFRSFVDCNPAPSKRLVLKIAETKEELEACFSLLHDAYVESGFMKPDASGMRLTIYHALPTTTTLCAKYDGHVVGTISLIRESEIGVPMQQIFDLTAIRDIDGNIAEASALAIHPRFRRTGGTILFPLMKFMYEYCTRYFDTRHLVIAVNPSHIEMYESLLFFRRLTSTVVEKYDFVNGAPAVGATLDLKEALEVFRKHYSKKPPHRNLHAYFTQVKLPNIKFPNRRFFTTNDPVLSPELLDYFFNVRTKVFENLSERKKALLHSIYDLPEYRSVLPTLSSSVEFIPIRVQKRFHVKCPARISVAASNVRREIDFEVIDVSLNGFQARAHEQLPLNIWCDVTAQLGSAVVSHFRALALRENNNGYNGYYAFRLGNPDTAWGRFVAKLEQSKTYDNLNSNSRFVI